MQEEIIQGILIPFAGTALGAFCVLFMKNMMNALMQEVLHGFAAGIMVAASIWSLLLPAMEQVEGMGRWAFLPAVSGFWMGLLCLLALNKVVSPLCQMIELQKESELPKSRRTTLKRTTMLVLAVTLHNIPEGMAVGASFVGYLSGNAVITITEAMALPIGIAIQNIPEGAIISMPLKSEGMKKGKAFLYGVLSGVVEPVAAFLTILVSSLIVPVLPYLLSFAAGAMIYVVVEELIPENSAGQHSNMGTVFFALGFTLMMALDVMM